MTASLATSQNSAILSRISSLTGWSERRTITSGWMPMPRSSLTECWVGLVFSSPVAASSGSSVTWTYRTFARPTSLRIWRIASRNGRLSMSPTVPPTSTMTTSGSPSRATRPIRSLISLVMWGITWTVPPR